MNRREALVRGIGTAAFAIGASALGAASEASSKPARQASANPNQRLLDAAYLCQKEGELCLEHCDTLLAAKDNTLAECARSVREMLVACRAISSLAVQKSAHIKEMAVLCGKICRECEAECLKHANHHEVCRQCGESCKACASECDKVA